jgi:hypothetical protein
MQQIDLDHARLHVGRPNTHPLMGKDLRALRRLPREHRAPTRAGAVARRHSPLNFERNR